MAKKKKNISAKELLEQALIPESECPYGVPENWVWTKMQYIASWGSGGTPSRSVPEYYNGNIPWIKTGELNNGFVFDAEENITEEALKKSSAKLFPVNTVMIAMYGATIGKVAIMGVSASTNQACACATTGSGMNFKYLFYYAMSQQDKFIKLAKGGAQPNISQEIIKNHIIPLPPNYEQQRIVDRIERFFKKLDSAKEIIENALDSFESRKAAILHQAFSGALTKQWREENNINNESWIEVKLSEIIKSVKGKFDPNNDLSIHAYIGLEHIEKGKGIIGKASSDDIKSLKSIFKFGDILYGKLRPYLNKHDIASFDGICSTDILVYRANSEITAMYVNYLMDTTEFIEYAVSNSNGINLPRVSEKTIGEYLIKLPSIKEQKEIVNILNGILKKEERAQEQTEINDSIEMIKKSILAKAFRGELGTNIESEESAMNLLEEIIQSQEAK